MMPLLYALEQHQALRSVQSQLRPSEGLLAFHNDIYVVTSLERMCEVRTISREGLWDNSRIQIHVGKTQIWNPVGVVLVSAKVGCESKSHLLLFTVARHIILSFFFAISSCT